MASSEEIKPVPFPPLNTPKSESTVRVHILNTTVDILSPASQFVKPPIVGQTYLNMPTFSFLVEHREKGKILFDLGARKDWWNLAKPNTDLMMTRIPGARVEKNVNEILKEGGVDDQEIKSVIWSHWHWDHSGDMSLFPPHTELVVGPGFKEHFIPGYPTNIDCAVLDTDFAGRHVNEISFDAGLRIGDYPAFDFFGDGSFYLLDTPGHAQGHLAALARTTPDTFVFMGGDICHYAAVYRPTQYAPMPSHIPASVPLHSRFPVPCPCAFFTKCHPNHADERKARTTPFYSISDKLGSWYSDAATAQKSVDSLQAFDADPNVLVCIAHDVGLPGVLDFFPNGELNGWREKGWKEGTAWGFMNDLPQDGKPTTPWIVDGMYKEGKIIGGGQKVLDMYE